MLAEVVRVDGEGSEAGEDLDGWTERVVCFCLNTLSAVRIFFSKSTQKQNHKKYYSVPLKVLCADSFTLFNL